MTYQDALDLIFQSFIAAKPHIAGKFDRDVRNPALILGIAEKLNLLPPPDRVIKVTGSKGKGTVARLCAHGLAGRGKVGLLVSPEEVEHTDRMRIDGQAITKDRFTEIFEHLWAEIDEPAVPDYLSPYGLFLLIALKWFRDEGVEHFVIETGRGVKFDEGGQLAGKVGVVTSVFLEHADYLGPDFEDIYEDKMSITETSEILVVGESRDRQGDMPKWYRDCQCTAQEALSAYLDEYIALPDGPCASFGQKTDDQGRTWIYEGLIAAESADVGYLANLPIEETLFLVSLPDDKDFEGVLSVLQDTGVAIQHIIMTGERGFMSYEQAARHDVAYKGAFDDLNALQAGLDVGEAKVIYFVGTQTYLRLVKQAFFS